MQYSRGYDFNPVPTQTLAPQSTAVPPTTTTASSPEMEPPGFEHVLAPTLPPIHPRPPSPPLSDSPPAQFETLNPNSPDEAPPGFDTPNAWAPVSGGDTWDPPPTHNQPTAALPSPEPEISPPANGTGNGMCSDFQLHEEPSVGEEMVGPEMPGESFDGAHTLGPRMAQTQEPVPMKGESVDSVQAGSDVSVSDTVCLEPSPEPTKSETLIESRMLGPPEAHPAATPLNPLPPPSSPPGASSEQTLSEVCHEPDTRVKEETNNPVLKPELVPRAEAPSESQIVQVPSVPVSPSAVPESVSERISLAPSPPPITSVSESIAPESSCENLDPVTPPPPPALTVHDTPKSPIRKFEYDNLNRNTCDRGLIGNNIAYEHEAMALAQPPLNLHEPDIPDPAMLPPAPPPPSPPQQSKCESLVPLMPEMTEVRHDNQQRPEEKTQDLPCQEKMMFPCSLRDGTSDTHSFETDSPIIQIIDEPPLKKSRDMYGTQGQSTLEECQSDDDDLFESVTPERDPHQDDDKEQIDMDMSDDDTYDRSPTHMGPPGSDARDFVSPGEAPPGYNTTDRTSPTGMISQNAFSGMGQMVCGNCHELISYPHGALHVLCTCCQTINLVLQACQVGNVTCGQCSVLLMYPFGAPSVRCSCCRYVTEIGVHNMRPPLSVQQGDSHPTLECQLTAN